MIAINWQQELGWGEGQLEEMRLMGYAYVKEGKWVEAITLFKALVVLAPSAVEDLQTLGALYLQRGESALALAVLERALKLDPNDELTRLNRAKALFVSGDIDGGIVAAETLTEASAEFVARSAGALLLAYQSQ